MPLSPGDPLGPYKILLLLGKGGMGEVWKARDPRLNRDVAIKISAQQYTNRFEREARAIAALNHSSICTLFDVGPNYLVMELVEGPTLAERMAQGPVALEEALAIARQIADALEAAHEKGIVHRDLKPANIKIRPDGSVKVLDFGLAKAGEEVEVTSDSPTMLSVSGMILGTAGYMSPEQARGKPVDKRADIFAFGVVLYEMVAGQRLFDGETVSDMLVAVIKEEPDWTKVPARLQRLLRRCLEKDPRRRLRDIGEVEFLLEEQAGQAISAPAVSLFRQPQSWLLLASAVALAAATGAAIWWLKPPTPVTHVVTRFQYALPEGQNFTRGGRHVLALSSDGTKLAYVVNQQLYLRAMDQLEAQPVRGTNEDPMEPVFSPDGQWLAYFVPAGGLGAGGSASAWVLKKIAVAGGAPVTLGLLGASPLGATWRGGMIAFGMNTGKASGIQAVSDSGGTVRNLVTVDPRKEIVAHPQFLADGKHVLFVSFPSAGNTGGEGQIVVQTLEGKDRRTLVSGGTNPRVLPSGQLVYIHDGTLLGVPFDSKRLAVTGGPVPLVEGVAQATFTGGAGQFAVSPGGTLAFRPGGAIGGPPRTLAWVDREGHEQPVPARVRSYTIPRLSPDGTKIVVSSRDEENDLWVFDLAKETLTRLTFGPAFDDYPVWTPDSRAVLYSSGPSPPSSGLPADIFRKAADGTGTIEALTQRLEGGYPRSLSPDGKLLVFRRNNDELFLLPLEPKGPAHALLTDPGFTKLNGEISPDGQWIAYDSNESGRVEIYVRPFPAVDGGRWQISSEGGTKPLWSRSGRELFFMTAANRMAAVAIAEGHSFTYGKPQSLFDAAAYYLDSPGRTFDVSADGKRFLMVKDGDKVARPSIVVVSHWFDEVKARMPAQR